MIAWRSPPAFLPPSMGVSVPNGDGPLSPLLREWKFTWTLGGQAQGLTGDDDARHVVLLLELVHHGAGVGLGAGDPRRDPPQGVTGADHVGPRGSAGVPRAGRGGTRTQGNRRRQGQGGHPVPSN